MLSQFLKSCFALISIVVLISACGPKVVHEENHSFNNQWSYSDSVSFKYTIQDTSKRYGLQLEVQHTDVYPFQNLYTRFDTKYPNGQVDKQQVSLELANKFGVWLGKCSGQNCTLTIPLQDTTRFPEPGTYQLTLHQFGRRDSLSGLKGLNFKVLEL